MRNSKLRILLECALLIALGTILAQIKIYRLPSGGSITCFSMVPFIVISFRHGVKWGLLSGFVNALLQMVTGGIYMPPADTLIALVGSILLDYVLAYMCLGLADIFAKPFKDNKKSFAYVFGTAMACLLRFVCAFLSGWLIWSDILGDGLLESAIYSISYNASYLIPETILTCIGIVLLQKSMIRLFDR